MTTFGCRSMSCEGCAVDDLVDHAALVVDAGPLVVGHHADEQLPVGEVDVELCRVADLDLACSLPVLCGRCVVDDHQRGPGAALVEGVLGAFEQLALALVEALPFLAGAAVVDPAVGAPGERAEPDRRRAGDDLARTRHLCRCR